MEIQGTVKYITYHNNESGYSIFGLKSGGEKENNTIKCLGVVDSIHEGDYLILDGDYVIHPVYGKQFKSELIRKDMPTDISAFSDYIASAIKGIGPVTAKRIVDMFGEDTFRIMEEEPKEIVKVPGISSKKAVDISMQMKEKKVSREEQMFFLQSGISCALAAKIIAEYKDKKDYKKVISNNPYQLIDDITGVGFIKADEIAKKMKIPENSMFRITHGIIYLLEQKADSDGHVYYPESLLLLESAKLLHVSEQDIQKGLNALVHSGKVIRKDGKDEKRCYLSMYYTIENKIAVKLNQLQSSYKDKEVNRNKVIRKIKTLEEKNNVTLDEIQREAVYTAVTSGITVITGGPGTGKTTTLNILIRYLEKEHLSIELAAPTGRAAKRMEKSAKRPARTIHRLISSNGDPFSSDSAVCIDADVVIIDEFSMVDILLMNSFLKAVGNGTKVIMVGDVDQLPSVGPGAVLKDIIQSGVFPITRLVKIHRQAAESNIIKNAYKINNGITLDIKEKNPDFFCMVNKDADNTVKLMKALMSPSFEKSAVNHFNIDPYDVQVLAPMRKGVLGIDNLNKILQNYLNPAAERKNEYQIHNTLFREGDKVMHIKNNYQMKWMLRKQMGTEVGTGIFNGDVGILVEIDKEEELARVRFEDDRIAAYSFEEMEQLQLAYAITIHKSQGSEYPVIIIPLLNGGPPMLYNRNLLYTAVTRASQCVIFIGNPKIIHSMQYNTKSKIRYTSLAECIQEVSLANVMYS